MIKPQEEFPLIEEYRKVFDITDDTIFAYDHNIYTNNVLPKHLIIHEETHHKQQDKYGLDTWVTYYLTDADFRLKMEVEAYKEQLKSINDREERFHLRMECIKNLTSSLYGNIVSPEEARRLLK